MQRKKGHIFRCNLYFVLFPKLFQIRNHEPCQQRLTIFQFISFALVLLSFKYCPKLVTGIIPRIIT